jgi:hypothetical protein
VDDFFMFCLHAGNKRLPDVGLWLKETTKNWWKEKGRHIEVHAHLYLYV